MSKDNTLNNEDTQNEALINQVNQEVRAALVSPTNEEKIPWEDFKHNLQKESIIPCLLYTSPSPRDS